MKPMYKGTNGNHLILTAPKGLRSLEHSAITDIYSWTINREDEFKSMLRNLVHDADRERTIVDMPLSKLDAKYANILEDFGFKTIEVLGKKRGRRNPKPYSQNVDVPHSIEYLVKDNHGDRYSVVSDEFRATDFAILNEYGERLEMTDSLAQANNALRRKTTV